MNRSRKSRDRGKGFTLVEVIVIVAIVGMLIGIGIPALQRLIVRSKLEGAAKQTATMMLSARFQAIKRGETVLVQVDTESLDIIAFVDSDLSGSYEGANDTLLNAAALTAGVEFAAPDSQDVIQGFETTGDVGTARFNPDGSAGATGAFRFADARRNYLEVRVDPIANARVEVQKWNEDLGEFLAQGEKGKTWDWSGESS